MSAALKSFYPKLGFGQVVAHHRPRHAAGRCATRWRITSRDRVRHSRGHPDGAVPARRHLGAAAILPRSVGARIHDPDRRRHALRRRGRRRGRGLRARPTGPSPWRTGSRARPWPRRPRWPRRRRPTISAWSRSGRSRAIRAGSEAALHPRLVGLRRLRQGRLQPGRASQVFHQVMEGWSAKRWREWGSEQCGSNFAIANSPDPVVLPYPEYASFERRVRRQPGQVPALHRPVPVCRGLLHRPHAGRDGRTHP